MEVGYTGTGRRYQTGGMEVRLTVGCAAGTRQSDDEVLEHTD